MEKVIPEFPNYKITDTGKVYSRYKHKTNIVCCTWREVQPVYDKSCGYLIVTLCHEGVRKNKRLHRLLAEAYIPNPLNKLHVNHLDGDKLNNDILSNPPNLEWATPKENAIHACNAGLCDERRKAQEVPILQYSGDEVTLLTEHVSLREAGRVTGIAWQNISKVVRGIRKKAGGYHWKYKKTSETIEKQ